jgi:hypothetical protein
MEAKWKTTQCHRQLILVSTLILINFTALNNLPYLRLSVCSLVNECGNFVPSVHQTKGFGMSNGIVNIFPFFNQKNPKGHELNSPLPFLLPINGTRSKL